MKIITNNILNRLFRVLRETDNFVFLDTSKPDELNSRSLLFLDPIDRMQHFEGEDEVQFLRHIQDLQKKGFYVSGWFSYEFGYLLEPALKSRLGRKEDKGALLADLGIYESCYTFDHASGDTDFPLKDLPCESLGDYNVENLRISQSREDYVLALGEILKYIKAGDTYQVNYTLKLFFDFDGSPEQFYSALRRNQSVGYGAYIRWNEERIMSFSPELFFWKKDASVMVRPMKGTLKRGRTLEEDFQNKKYLKSDIKNQSENVMIVDLLRNDLGRLMHHISDGKVEVDSLFDVETYETLLQMTSTITGKTQKEALENVSLLEFFKAIFPCGSVTGAPKIRTMEIIDELEKERRGVYTGAIGYMQPSGDFVFNVPIRTIILNDKGGEMGIGSGIVHDSNPHQEWRECLLKGRFLIEPQEKFHLIETLLWSARQGYFFLDNHLERLCDSAKYFLFSCNIKVIKNELLLLSEKFGKKSRRVRLLLEKDGRIRVEASECADQIVMSLPEKPEMLNSRLPQICLSKKKVDSKLVWFYHKTSNRDLYNSEYAKACENGFIDVFFQNEDGCITEGSISNIILYKDGEYLTPPLKDGLLAGVMRQCLLNDHTINLKEKSLTVADVRQAEALFICNSVRGVVQVAYHQK